MTRIRGIREKALLPCRVIMGTSGPYLSRYRVVDFGNHGQLFLHRFHRGDEDRELHCHPWLQSVSLVLAGGYREERRVLNADGAGTIGTIVQTQVLRPGALNWIAANDYHRVDLLEDEAWTLFLTGETVQKWSFWNRDTGTVTPWKDFIRAKGLTPDEKPTPSRT